jgi:hypothetical protein
MEKPAQAHEPAAFFRPYVVITRLSIVFILLRPFSSERSDGDHVFPKFILYFDMEVSILVFYRAHGDVRFARRFFRD